MIIMLTVVQVASPRHRILEGEKISFKVKVATFSSRVFVSW